MKTEKTGIELIAEERQEQINKHMWTAEHDETHNGGELAMMAACYCAPKEIYIKQTHGDNITFRDPFPFDDEGDKRFVRANPDDKECPLIRRPVNPMYFGKADAIKMLTRAGALIAAEIDRIQNLEQ